MDAVNLHLGVLYCFVGDQNLMIILALRSRYSVSYGFSSVHWCIYCSSYEGAKYLMVCRMTFFLIVVDCYD